MKRLKLIIISLLAIAIILVALTGFNLYRFAHRSNRQPATLILIEPGSSLKKIARTLAKRKLISTEAHFISLNRLLQSSTKLKAGEYLVAAGADPLKIIATLQEGISFQRKISFPEGFTLKQIKARLKAQNICRPDEFEKLTTTPASLDKWQVQAPNLEGYLFPSTYCYSRKTSCSKMLEQMLETGKQRFLELTREGSASSLNRQQIITLASIIQKEAGNNDEMPLISAVFHNRLRRKMRLASDPTTIYGLGENFDGNLRRRDLRDPSPYNTYRHKGLPPGPICSPGSEAIKAALNPVTSDYLFFVSRNNGTHKFSKTYAEHKRAVKKYQLKQ